MRYYDILISDPKSGDTVKHWSAIQKDGTPDPGALKVEMDVFVVAGNANSGESSLTIYGVSLHDLFNANNLYQKHIEVRAGMTGGLPLEKPWQAGVIFAGKIFQSVGNWVGTDMSISLMMNPSDHSRNNPGNYVLHWEKGQHLKEALANTFHAALPALPHHINISDKLVASSTRVKVAPTIHVLAEQVYDETKQIYSDNGHPNEGVDIGIRQGGVYAWDSTKKDPIIQLNFEDLIGQPTWFDKLKLEFMTQMRADISLSDRVQMPNLQSPGGNHPHNMPDIPGLVQTKIHSYPSQPNYKDLFTGTFRINKVRYIGDNRSPEGKEWATVFIAVPE